MSTPWPSQRLLAAMWTDRMAGQYADDTVVPHTYDYTWVNQVPSAYAYVGSVASTAQNVGSNFAVTGSAVATSMTADADRPAVTSLQVVRYYNKKRSVASGTADTPDTSDAPSAPGRADATDVDMVPDVLVPAGEEKDAVQVTDREVVQAKGHGRVRVRRYYRRPARGTVLSPARMTRIAVSIVGPKRREIGNEWQSHLFGEPGHGLSQRKQVRAARGFLWSAIQIRLQHAADLAWRPVDAVLGSRTLSNLFVWGPVFVVLLAIVRHDGRYGLVADIQDPIALGIFLYAVIYAGRRIRGIKPPKPKTHRPRE